MEWYTFVYLNIKIFYFRIDYYYRETETKSDHVVYIQDMPFLVSDNIVQ